MSIEPLQPPPPPGNRTPRQRQSLAWFRFYEELNDFLSADRRKRSFPHDFDRRASIKDMIESFGVPHTEVELILVNGNSVDFSHIVADADYISVYPVFESLDIRPLLKLRPEPQRKPDDRQLVKGLRGQAVSPNYGHDMQPALGCNQRPTPAMPYAKIPA